MEYLMDAIDKELKAHNLDPISDKVNNMIECHRYINRILKKYKNFVEIKSVLPSEYDYRIKHILFSFGLGFVLAKYANLSKEIEKAFSKYGNEFDFVFCWLTLCLYHDYGYYISDEFKDIDDLNMIKIDYNLFDDYGYQGRYSNQLYRDYYKFRYKCNYDKYFADDNDCEIGDHGVLGGYVLYDRLCVNMYSQKDKAIDGTFKSKIKVYRNICYHIMEHNIWKQDKCYENAEYDFSEIYKENFKKISLKEQLLYLLSLVDTIEMTKRFCRYSDKDEKQKEHFVYPKTVGKNVSIEVTNDMICIIYNKLNDFIAKKNYNTEFEDWEQGVKRIEDWVEIRVSSSHDKGIVRLE